MRTTVPMSPCFKPYSGSRSSKQSGQVLCSSLAGVQDGQADNFLVFVANDDVVVGEFAVGGRAGLFEVDVEHICLGVIRRPEVAARRSQHEGRELDVTFYFG